MAQNSTQIAGIAFPQLKEDCLKHRELVQQLKERTASGEKNLVIRNLGIIIKKDADLLQTAVPQQGMILD